MGHNIHYATYPENVNKKIVQNEWDEYAAHEDWQEGCSGLPGKIRWLDHVCDTPEEAEEYISSHDKGNYGKCHTGQEVSDSHFCFSVFAG